jgi:hypothetical protein
MKIHRKANSSAAGRTLDGRLAGYLTAAGAVTAAMATDAKAVVVGNNTVQPFGINGAVNIDFNQDGQTDFQIDHDRVTLPSGGPTLDYLQIDKNDINGESNPLAFDPGPNATFNATPFQDGATARNQANDSAYVIAGPQGSYPAALTAGAPVGPLQTFDFQETDNFQGGGKWIRANRLIDEDHTQIDQVLGGRSASGVQVPTNGPNFTGLAPSDVRYLGVKMNLNGSGLINYGWVGVRITNQADATGEVVGYGYETTPGVGVLAGQVPEPTTIVSALFGGVMAFGFLWRRLRRR